MRFNSIQTQYDYTMLMLVSSRIRLPTTFEVVARVSCYYLPRAYQKQTPSTRAHSYQTPSCTFAAQQVGKRDHAHETPPTPRPDRRTVRASHLGRPAHRARDKSSP